MQVLSKLEELSRRYEELDDELSKPEIISDPNKLKKVAKEQADLTDIIKVYRVLTAVMNEISEMENIIADNSDAELVEMAREDLPALETKKTALENELALLLLPRDPNDSKNTFLEIRAGTGGEEAALFAADLFRRVLPICRNQGMAGRAYVFVQCIGRRHKGSNRINSWKRRLFPIEI